MIASFATEEIICFRDLIAQRLGLHFGEEKLNFLAEVLWRRIEETRCGDFPAYRTRIASAGDPYHEVRSLARELTVGETYFFRYTEHFQALAEVVIPNRIRARVRGRRLRILSAGCASGEEPYSIAILLRQRFPDVASWDVQIRAVDVNPTAIHKAARARYSAWSLRETSLDVRAKYFRPDGHNFQLNEEIQQTVTFEQRNLIEDDPLFWDLDGFDVIFCRNVIMYLSPDVTRWVVSRLARSIAPGGYLFLGHAETLRGLSQEFQLRHTNETFYYQHREASETGCQGIPSPAFSGANVRHQIETGDEWFSAIGRASERVATLTRPKNRGLAEMSATAPKALRVSTTVDCTPAIKLLREERFSEAIALLRGLPDELAEDTDTHLLLAALLTNSGNLPQAELFCQRVLALDEMNAGAHYLMALCREYTGDRQAAAKHDQTAAYLDNAFAMPRLHLGLAAKRAGDVETARRELAAALPLLEREDASRILLFGGGFTRDALVAFCRSQLRGCGGAF